MDSKEIAILARFRNNARENLTTASKSIRIPISTIYDRLRRYEGNIIQKHTSLLDFGQLGYSIRIHLAVKVPISDRERLLSFLQKHPRVNSLHTVSNGYSFLFEVILRNLSEAAEFAMSLEIFNVVEKQEFYVVEDIKRESFLTDPSMYDMPIRGHESLNGK